MRARAFWIALALAYYGILDWVLVITHFEGSVSLYCLIPVVLVTWHGSWWGGILMGLLCVSQWWPADASEPFDGYRQMLAYWNSAMEAGLYVVVSLALTALKRALSREAALARTDPLTGAPNRRAFEEAAGRELDRARRHGHPLTLALLDADGFKAVNDRLGHGAGDALLKSAAAALRSRLRASDVLARIGGDEFALLLPETGPEQAREPLERVRLALEAAMQAGGWAVSFSIGAAGFAKPEGSLEEMLRLADAEMYAVKGGGKGRVSVASR